MCQNASAASQNNEITDQRVFNAWWSALRLDVAAVGVNGQPSTAIGNVSARLRLWRGDKAETTTESVRDNPSNPSLLRKDEFGITGLGIVVVDSKDPSQYVVALEYGRATKHYFMFALHQDDRDWLLVELREVDRDLFDVHLCSISATYE